MHISLENTPVLNYLYIAGRNCLQETMVYDQNPHNSKQNQFHFADNQLELLFNSKWNAYLYRTKQSTNLINLFHSILSALHTRKQTWINT